MRYYVIVLFLMSSLGLAAKDSLIISRLLHRISALQVTNDGIFPKGSIPSYRMYALNQHRYKADINPFFTALTGFTLRYLKNDFAPEQKILVDSIIEKTMDVYPLFSNKKNVGSIYNFWSTDKRILFPHSGFLNLFSKSQSLPDDCDDTVMILMAQGCSDSIAQSVHQIMQRFANNKGRKITNTFPEYQQIGAYSTWLGYKMPVDFDICVLSNVLYFVQHYNLEWSAADSASLYLIEDMIKNRKHRMFTNYVSPHYATLPNILYHISRLMAVKPIPSLEKLKPQLIEDAKRELASAHTFMDKVILSTTLLRWNVIPPDIIEEKTTNLIDLIEDEQFYFFIANMASFLPNTLKRGITNLKVGTFYYYAPGFNHVLFIENLIWRKRRKLSS